MNAPGRDDMTAVLANFQAIGATFVSPLGEIAQKLGNCRAVVFDWDGVFNDGRKGQTSDSGFSEADSMGTNMLRYALWRKLGQLPYSAIISGENNGSAVKFAKREHLTDVYTGIADKRLIINRICQSQGLEPDQIACVFDDINDLPMAGLCGIRLMVRRNASPLFAKYVARRFLCDYVSGVDSQHYAVREICEMLLGVMGCYGEVVTSRVSLDKEYRDYLDARQSVVTGAYNSSELGNQD